MIHRQQTVSVPDGGTIQLTRPGIGVTNIQIAGPFRKAMLSFQDEHEIDTIYAELEQRSFQITDTHCLPHAHFHPLRLRVWSSDGTDVIVTYENPLFRRPSDRDVYYEFPFVGTRQIKDGTKFELLWNDIAVHLRGDGIEAAELVLSSSQRLPLIQKEALDVSKYEGSVSLLVSPPTATYTVWTSTKNILRSVSSMYGLSW